MNRRRTRGGTLHTSRYHEMVIHGDELWAFALRNPVPSPGTRSCNRDADPFTCFGFWPAAGIFQVLAKSM